MRNRIICLIFIVCFLMNPSTSTAAVPIVLDFEAHFAMGYVEGTLISENAKLFEDYLDSHGVVFSSGSPYCAVVNLGYGHATSGSKGVGGSNEAYLTYKPDYPIIAAFFNPSNISQKATTDFVSLRTDLWPGPVGSIMQLEGYDCQGRLIASDSAVDTGGVTLSLSEPGIHMVQFSGLYVAIDDFMFNPIVPAENGAAASADVYPTSFLNTLVTAGDSVTHSLIISNTGTADLEFSFCSAKPNDDSLILHYTFEHDTGSSVIDQSGYGNDGMLMNECIYTDGVDGTGLEIRGNSSTYSSAGGHVLLPHLNINAMSEITVALWVKEKAIHHAHGEGYINIGAQPKANGRIYIGNVTYNSLYAFTVGNETTKLEYTPPVQEEFVHYAMTHSGGITRAYRNGMLVGQTNSAFKVDYPQYAALGRHWWDNGASSSTRLTAVFDDVRIYNRKLSDMEVQELCSPSSGDGLIAHYPFNSNALDESGNGHDGVVHGAELVEDRFGNQNSAFDFNGSSDYINCGNIIAEFSNFTVSAWINIDRFTNTRYMGPWSQTLFANSSISVHSAYSMYTASYPVGCFGTSMRWVSGGEVMNTRVGHIVPINEWHLITQTYDGNEVRQYDNGILINTTETGAHILNNPWDFLIGKTAAYPNFWLSTHYFDGAIDDVRIYSRALSPAEILELYSDNVQTECMLPDWLIVEPKSGTIPPGGSVEVAITMGAMGMVAGDYASHELNLFSNDSDMPTVVIPVSMWIVPPAPVMMSEPEYTAWKTNGVFWSMIDGPVTYFAEADATEHCSPGRGGDKFVPKGWSNVKRFHDPDRWMQQSDWIETTSYLFTDLRLNTKYQYRVKASVDTEIGRLESDWSDWVESCQVPHVKHVDESRVPMAWKEKHFGRSDNFQGLVDSDGDGLCNYDEYVAAGDPFDKTSSFKIKECSTCAEGHFILTWDSVPGRVYSVYWTPSISTPFQLLESEISYPQNSYTDTVHNATSGGFYKIGVQLAE